jgi:hypothetical protein
MPSPVEILGIVLIAVALFMLVARGFLNESNFQTPILTLKAPTSVVILVLGIALFLFPQWWPVVTAARQTIRESPGPSAEAAAPSPSVVESATVESAKASPAATASARPSAITPPTFVAESVVESVTEKPDLNIRGQAGTNGKPVAPLPRGTRMLVLSGPIARDKYDWYEVLTFPSSQRDIPSHGWVAAGAPNGRPWIGQVVPECPSPPTTVGGLAPLDASTALACFSRRPLTIRARLLRCGTPPVQTIQSDPCAVSPGTIQPAWLDPDSDVLPDAGELDRFVLVDLEGDIVGNSPSVRLVLAQDAARPKSLDDDQAIEVTGMFNHPSAGQCTFRRGGESGGEPTIACRATFVATELKVLTP